MMKATVFYTFLVVCLTISACKKEDSGVGVFQAKVVSLNSGCGPPLIYFEGKDIAAVERITRSNQRPCSTCIIYKSNPYASSGVFNYHSEF